MSVSTFPMPINGRLVETDEFVWVIAIELLGGREDDDRDEGVWFHIVRTTNLHDVVPRDELKLYPGEQALQVDVRQQV